MRTDVRFVRRTQHMAAVLIAICALPVQQCTPTQHGPSPRCAHVCLLPISDGNLWCAAGSQQSGKPQYGLPQSATFSLITLSASIVASFANVPNNPRQPAPAGINVVCHHCQPWAWKSLMHPHTCIVQHLPATAVIMQGITAQTHHKHGSQMAVRWITPRCELHASLHVSRAASSACPSTAMCLSRICGCACRTEPL